MTGNPCQKIQEYLDSKISRTSRTRQSLIFCLHEDWRISQEDSYSKWKQNRRTGVCSLWSPSLTLIYSLIYLFAVFYYFLLSSFFTQRRAMAPPRPVPYLCAGGGPLRVPSWSRRAVTSLDRLATLRSLENWCHGSWHAYFGPGGGIGSAAGELAPSWLNGRAFDTGKLIYLTLR